MTLSRSAIIAGLLVLPSVASADADAIARGRALTTVEPRCGAPGDAREILVCANRRADRWRVPFVGYDTGDPRGEGVPAERERLAAAPRVPCGKGAIIANCGGGVGVAARATFGVSGSALRARPLAQ